MFLPALFSFWLAFFPFVSLLPIFPYSEIDLEGPRWIWLNGGVLFLFLVLAYRLFFTQSLIVVNRLFLFLGILFMLWLSLTALVGFDFEQSFWGSLFRHQGVLTYVFLFALFCFLPIIFKAKKDYFLWSASLSSFAASFLALLEIPLVLGDFSRTGYGGRLIGPFGQPNFLAEYLVLLLPMQVALFLKTTGLRKRVFIIFSIIIAVGVILATFSRTGIFGLLVAAVMLAWYFRKRLNPVWQLGSAVAVFVATGLIVVGFLFLPQAESQRRRILEELKPDPTRPTEQRIPIWTTSLNLIQDKPATGWGLENLGDVIVANKDRSHQALHAIYVDRAHSYILDLALGGGLPLLLIFLFFSFFIVYKRIARQSFLGMSALTFIAMSITNIPSVSLLVWYWAVLGIIASPVELVSLQRNFSRVRIFSFVVLLSIVFFAFNYIVVSPHRASLAFKNMQEYILENNYASAALKAKEAQVFFPHFSVYRKYAQSFR